MCFLFLQRWKKSCAKSYYKIKLFLSLHHFNCASVINFTNRYRIKQDMLLFFYFRICPHHTYASFCLLFLLIFNRSHVFSWHKMLWIGCCKSKSCEAVVLLIPCSVQGQQQMWPEVLLLESWPSLNDSLTTWEGHHN